LAIQSKKDEASKFFCVHDGDRQNAQPGAKCGYFYLVNVMANGSNFFFQVEVPKMTCILNLSTKLSD